ncbi:MAG TPA: TetR/AcrR family transcriptional regulator, partial [bacterium]|nr:TetR/AcrR family transcriptional regulator [bacterium]
MKTISTPSQIINTARKLFSEYGYLGVSMQDIARRLKLTKPALYYHFSSKKEIYKKVIEEVFKELKNELQQALKKPPSQRGKEVIKTYLKFGLKDKNFIRILLFKLKTKDRQIKK